MTGVQTCALPIWLAWWQILLAIIVLIAIIWLLLKFAPAIVYAIIKIIALPFKAIAKLFKKKE